MGFTAVCGTFYFSDITVSYDWTSPQNNSLWRDNIKNLFDPCPPGWRVPRSGEGQLSPLIGFTSANGPWITQNNDAGHLFNSSVVYSGSTWYTACGWRGYAHGHLDCVKGHADIWFSTASGTGSYNLYSVAEGVFPTSKASRAYSFPIRCIRE